MDETYPILFHGEKKGELTRTQRGLFTEFSARCEDTGGVVRLSVYGGDREGYLGVMEPADGALHLTRRLSRTATAGFPAVIEYAAPAGEPIPSGEASRPETPCEPRGADPPAPAEANTDLLWYQAGDGSLVTTWEGKQYRAIPMAAWGVPMEHALEKRTIDGVDYAVFALRDSQVI